MAGVLGNAAIFLESPDFNALAKQNTPLCNRRV